MPGGHDLDLGTLLGPVAAELVDRLRSARTRTERFLELGTWEWRELAGCAPPN